MLLLLRVMQSDPSLNSEDPSSAIGQSGLCRTVQGFFNYYKKGIVNQTPFRLNKKSRILEEVKHFNTPVLISNQTKKMLHH